MSTPTPMPAKEKGRIIYMACDGFGQTLLNEIQSHLESKEASTNDDSDNNDHSNENSTTKTKTKTTVHFLGCDTYYDAAASVAKKVNKSDSDNDNDSDVFGILFCGTGMGVGIVANKFPGVRAATCENVLAAKCARSVNNANVLCLGQLVTNVDDAKNITDAFLNQEFIAVPTDDDGRALNWWNANVEDFLSTSMEGIERVEKEAKASMPSTSSA